MGQILFKGKPLEIIESYSDYSFKVMFKNKVFFAVKFDDQEEFFDFTYKARRLANSGMSAPKIIKTDNKSMVVLLTYIDGVKPIELLLNNEMNEDVYRLLYQNNFMARINKMQPSYDLDKWIYNKNENKLYYVGYDYSEKIDKEYLMKTGIRLWNYTEEFKRYCLENGYQYDEKLFKSEFETNKGILLIACKYYK